MADLLVGTSFWCIHQPRRPLYPGTSPGSPRGCGQSSRGPCQFMPRSQELAFLSMLQYPFFSLLDHTLLTGDLCQPGSFQMLGWAGPSSFSALPLSFPETGTGLSGACWVGREEDVDRSPLLLLCSHVILKLGSVSEVSL